MIDLFNSALSFTLDSGFATWLAGLRLLANLTIVVAIASVTCTLYSLSSRHASGLPPPRWLVVSFATALGLCAICHLARALGFGTPAVIQTGPVFMRVAIAAFWVIIAIKMPVLVNRLIQPLKDRTVSTFDDKSMEDLIALVESMKPKIHSIVGFARDESRLLNQKEKSRPIGDTFAEREAT